MTYPQSHNGVKNNMYSMSVYSKSGRFRNSLIGDIYEGSLIPPKRGITFWAYFSNEPSEGQEANCILDINAKSNYRNDKKKRLEIL